MATEGQVDHLLKVLLVGDSGVGKSALLVRFTLDQFQETSQPTIGVDFHVKKLVTQGKTLRLNIWDTAGQERFRTLTSSYYRGAQAIVYVYDVTRRETLDSLEDVWMTEVDTFKTLEHPATMVVGNKADLEGQREVSRADGMALARRQGCLFAETSAKSGAAVAQAFEELVLKVLDSPQLLAGSTGSKQMGLDSGGQDSSRSSCC